MSTTEISVREADIQSIMGEALPEIEDTEQAQRAMVERILSADDLAGLFPDGSTTATRELIGQPIEVRDCRIMRGDIEGSRGVYMLLDIVNLATGETLVANTGAPNIMASVLRAKRLNVLPFQVEVVEVARAKPGRSAPLGLRPTGETMKQLKGKGAK